MKYKKKYARVKHDQVCFTSNFFSLLTMLSHRWSNKYGIYNNDYYKIVIWRKQQFQLPVTRLGSNNKDNKHLLPPGAAEDYITRTHKKWHGHCIGRTNSPGTVRPASLDKKDK